MLYMNFYHILSKNGILKKVEVLSVLFLFGVFCFRHFFDSRLLKVALSAVTTLNETQKTSK